MPYAFGSCLHVPSDEENTVIIKQVFLNEAIDIKNNYSVILPEVSIQI